MNARIAGRIVRKRRERVAISLRNVLSRDSASRSRATPPWSQRRYQVACRQGSRARAKCRRSRAFDVTFLNACVTLMSHVDPKGRISPNCAFARDLRTLLFGPEHGQGIARAIQQRSEETFLVDHSSLYPALQRLEARGWVCAEWGTSRNNRKARFYELTRTGRKRLISETRQWRLLSAAIGRILGPEEA
jgi:PadR family transcriptional regulator PadR